MPWNKARLLGITLGATGGFADASSYQLAGCFTGHVTGNIILSVVALIGSRPEDLHRPITTLTLFILFTWLGQLWRASGDGRLHAAAVSGLELVLAGLACAGVSRGSTEAMWWLVVCMPIALGLQNGFFTAVDGVSVHTTYMTGATTKLLNPKEDWSERSVVLEVWLSFLAGAALAVTSLRFLGPRGLWFVEFPLLATLLIDLQPLREA